jgi:hypothetical protein
MSDLDSAPLDALSHSSHANYLTDRDKLQILKLLEEGVKTQQQIADQFVTTQQNVSALALDHLVRPKDVLRLAGPRASRNWVKASDEGAKRGLHAASKDLLLHIGAIEPLREESKATIVVQLGVVLSPLLVEQQGVTATPLDGTVIAIASTTPLSKQTLTDSIGQQQTQEDKVCVFGKRRKASKSRAVPKPA